MKELVTLTLRVDSTMHKKLKYLARRDATTISGKLKAYIVADIRKFEKEYGEIPLDGE
ncbi:hypothetical protein LJC32_03560 [Oscillospiraceae bacterium OttesenSCG-928-F05]|nr:hypothetical protein [Oscillospiraceae bacterium OttesenSCG-928-F05]